MKQFRVHSFSGGDFFISGESLADAVEKNFSSIAQHFRIGNVAGYSLDRVYMSWRDGILGGKGGAELHIICHGSDYFVDYDPHADPSSDTVVWIHACPEDVPSPFEFEINRAPAPAPTPFDSTDTPGIAAGYAMAIMDEIAMHHSACPPSLPPQQQVLFKSPNALVASPRFALESMRSIMESCTPKHDKMTSRLLARLSELFLQLSDSDVGGVSFNADATVYAIKGKSYFADYNKITALSFYRSKAGLTGKQLADAVGISERQIRNYENPHSSTLGCAKFSVVQSIASVLGVRPEQLVDRGLTVLVDPSIDNLCS